MPDSLAEVVAEHGLVVRPDFGFYAEDGGDGDGADDTGDAAGSRRAGRG